MNTLKFERLHPLAILPIRSSEGAAGLDLHTVERVSVSSGARAAVRTGLAVEIPRGFYGRVAPRSGLALHMGIDVMAGVIDSDYRGEIVCLLVNLGGAVVSFDAGDRIAQLIVETIVLPQPIWSDKLLNTDRDDRGFGSSGK